ncbi:hypothetical protein KFK09_002399 [Dendrobium nobile]|uniref:Uncharacterized protein n=1 Tax=Dendrobium nobile TaxID=94219 RepID=A0A8T3C3L7_DENNO|nr:hypothetical protein KFK09_002399 [Dendrobium nobile]
MAKAVQMKDDDSDEDIFLDDSFFVNRDYELTTFTFGNSVLQLFCLRSSSTDYDLTGQLVWPGAVLLNNYLSGNPKMLEGLSIIELGSGVGITGILCSRFCSEVVLTDHNDEVLEVSMDEMVINEAVKLGMEVNEVAGTRSIISNLQGVIYEIILPKQQ